MGLLLLALGYLAVALGTAYSIRRWLSFGMAYLDSADLLARCNVKNDEDVVIASLLWPVVLSVIIPVRLLVKAFDWIMALGQEHRQA